MAYNKTVWNNGSTPPINAANLNKIEQGIYDNSINKADASNTYTKTETDNLLSAKQDFFATVTDSQGDKTLTTESDKEVFFSGRFRFMPDSQATENQYDLINREMLESAISAFFTSISGYDATRPQYLMNNRGTLQWVNE